MVGIYRCTDQAVEVDMASTFSVATPRLQLDTAYVHLCCTS